MKKMNNLRYATALLLLSAGAFGCAKRPPAKAAAPKPTAAKTQAAKPLATKNGISILEAVACSSIENRACAGENSKFSSKNGRVYIYTKVGVDSREERSIRHVWLHKGKEVSAVTLPVKGFQWRTYSLKKIDASQKGDWRVDIFTDKNELLKSVSFSVE